MLVRHRSCISLYCIIGSSALHHRGSILNTNFAKQWHRSLKSLDSENSAVEHVRNKTTAGVDVEIDEIVRALAANVG